MSETKETYFAEERKQKILELLASSKKITIPEMCTLFNVSTSTMRNDLRNLQDAGLITRTHGGAIAKRSKSGFEPRPSENLAQRIPEKKAIAAKAIELVEEDDIIFIGTGTTTFEFVKLLPFHKKNLTVITNDIYFAAHLEEHSEFTVIIQGGVIRNNFHYVQNPLNGNIIDGFNVDKTFIGCNGIHPERGVTIPDFQLASNLRCAIKASAETIVLSDSSKFGATTFAQIIPVFEVGCIITDNRLPEAVAASYTASEVEILMVSCND